MTTSARTHGFVIPTAFCDPARLRQVVARAHEQTLRPVEVVVVAPDDTAATGDLDARLVRVHRPGTAHQRNAGLLAARADIVHLLDDDVLLAPDYVRRIDTAFDDPGVVGATGLLAHASTVHVVRPGVRRFLAGRSPSGRVSPTGAAQPIDPTGGDHEVTWLPGALSALRRSALDGLRFDEVLERGPTGPYALHEDVDFSYRLSRRGRLRFVAAARATHLGTDGGRLASPQYWEMRALVRRYFAGKADLGLSPVQARAYLAVDVALVTALVVSGRSRISCLRGAARGIVGPPLDRRPPP